MKKLITIIAIASTFVLTGCVSLERTLRLTQEIGGDGSLSIETPLGSSDVIVKNARQENGRFKADEIEIEVVVRFLGRVHLEATNYSRPIIE